jgi:hypothetical protein
MLSLFRYFGSLFLLLFVMMVVLLLTGRASAQCANCGSSSAMRQRTIIMQQPLNQVLSAPMQQQRIFVQRQVPTTQREVIVEETPPVVQREREVIIERQAPTVLMTPMPMATTSYSVSRTMSASGYGAGMMMRSMSMATPRRGLFNRRMNAGAGGW